MALTPKRLNFIDEYFRCNLNATEAYLKLYPDSDYESARRSASRLLTNDDVREEVNRRLTEKHMSADEVLSRLSEQAKGEYASYLTTDGKINFEKLVLDGKGYLVSKIKPGKFGLEIEFYNSQNALINMGKQHGLFSDRHIIETKIEKELDTILAILEETLSSDDFQRVISRLSNTPSSQEVAEE